MRIYRGVGAIAAASLLTLVTACGSDDSASEGPGASPDAAATTTQKPQKSGPPSVSIRNNKVSPSTLEVETGDTVKIRNEDSVGHRLDSRKDHLYSGTIPAKGKGELTAPPDPGTYVFTDPNHTSARLKLKVR